MYHGFQILHGDKLIFVGCAGFVIVRGLSRLYPVCVPQLSVLCLLTFFATFPFYVSYFRRETYSTPLPRPVALPRAAGFLFMLGASQSIFYHWG